MAQKTVVPGEGQETNVAEQRMLQKVQTLMPDARVHNPAEAGKYYGEVLFASKDYVVQQVGPQSVVAHPRGQLGDLPLDNAKPGVRALEKFGGAVVDVNYDNGKGTVGLADPERWHERKSREPATEQQTTLARSYLGEQVGVYKPPMPALGISARYEGVVVNASATHAIQRINGRTAIVHDLGDHGKDLATLLEKGQKAAFVYDKGTLKGIEPIERERGRERDSQGKSATQQHEQNREGREKSPEDLKRESFFIARNTVRHNYGSDIKIYDAAKVGNDPKFEGRIVAQSSQHVIQRVAAKSFIAHERSALDADLKVGKFVEIAYAGDRAKTAEKEVRRDRQSEVSREPAQRNQGMSR